MSYIIKALKKLEGEKAVREGLKEGSTRISPALLAADHRPQARLPRALPWLAIPLMFCAGGAATYLLLPAAPTKAPKKEEALRVSAPTTPPAQPPRPAPQPPAQAAGKSAAPASIAPVPASNAPAKKAVVAKPPKPSPVPRVSTSEAVMVAAPPQIKVSGIGYQDDPAESMAVVNGALLRMGMTVGDLRVVRIFPDRVRFRGSGGTFEVPLAK